MSRHDVNSRIGADYVPPSRDAATRRPENGPSVSSVETHAGSTRDAFLIALNDRLRPLRDPLEIQREAVRVLGEHLEVAWVHYAECDDDLSAVTIHNEYLAAGMRSLTGYHSLAGCERLMVELAAGRTVAEDDLRSPTFVDGARGAQFAANGSLSFAATPIVKEGQLIAAISVIDDTTRTWRREELALLEETAERTWAAVERARAEQAVAIELRDTRLLHELSARLVSEHDADAFFDAILAAAIAITGAVGGTIRLADTQTGELVLLATRGLEQSLTKQMRRLPAVLNTTTSRAVATGQRSFTDFEDPTTPDPLGTRRLHLEAGVRSAQSTPLITRDGRAIGSLTTHWSELHTPTERERRSLDMLARQTAELIERRRADDALRASQTRLSAELADMKLLQTLSAQLIHEDDSTTLHHTLVQAASSIMHSDFAVLQILHPERGPDGELRLLASRGFTPDVVAAWEWVSWSAETTCGLAMRNDTRVVAADITRPDLAIGDAERAMYLRTGVRS
ncbi:MAG TPA: GAF domain-containing protein, partial [Gemmatimonadaceae bacterium]